MRLLRAAGRNIRLRRRLRVARLSGRRAVLVVVVVVVLLIFTRGHDGCRGLAGVPRLGRSRPRRAVRERALAWPLRERAAASLERAGAREPALRRGWALLPLVEVERIGPWLRLTVLRRGRASLEVVRPGYRRLLVVLRPERGLASSDSEQRDRSRRAVLQHVRRQIASVHQVLRGEAAGCHQNRFPLLRCHLLFRRHRRAVGLASPVAEAAAIAVASSRLHLGRN